MSNYNYIYSQLVEAPNDVVGALAYALYKHEKREYIEKFKTARGSDPTDADLEHFHIATNTPARIGAYKQSAEALLNNFLDEVLSAALVDRMDQLEAEMQRGAVLEARSAIINKIETRHSFWRGVGQNIIAGLVATAVTFGFILGAWMWNEGPSTILLGGLNRYFNGPTASTQLNHSTPLDVSGSLDSASSQHQ